MNRDPDPFEPGREGINASESVERGQPQPQEQPRDKSRQPFLKTRDRDASAPQSPDRIRSNDHALLAKTDSQRALLGDLGRFRTVALPDIAACPLQGVQVSAEPRPTSAQTAGTGPHPCRVPRAAGGTDRSRNADEKGARRYGSFCFQ